MTGCLYVDQLADSHTFSFYQWHFTCAWGLYMCVSFTTHIILLVCVQVLYLIHIGWIWNINARELSTIMAGGELKCSANVKNKMSPPLNMRKMLASCLSTWNIFMDSHIVHLCHSIDTHFWGRISRKVFCCPPPTCELSEIVYFPRFSKIIVHGSPHDFNPFPQPLLLITPFVKENIIIKSGRKQLLLYIMQWTYLDWNLFLSYFLIIASLLSIAFPIKQTSNYSRRWQKTDNRCLGFFELSLSWTLFIQKIA